jgi:hypothetical protein
MIEHSFWVLLWDADKISKQLYGELPISGTFKKIRLCNLGLRFDEFVAKQVGIRHETGLF